MLTKELDLEHRVVCDQAIRPQPIRLKQQLQGLTAKDEALFAAPIDLQEFDIRPVRIDTGFVVGLLLLRLIGA
jgi:hypothetical protein